MELEQKVIDALDKLTDQVSVEDAAILVGGFYAGMHGYTPLTALSKMLVTGNEVNDVKKDLIIALFGIPGLGFASIVQALSNNTTKMNGESDSTHIKLEDMDPRRITSDYLYDRMMYLKNLKKTAEQFIQKNLDDIATKQLQIQQKNQEIADLKHQIANEVEPGIIEYLRQLINTKTREIMDLQDDISRLYQGIDVYKSQMVGLDLELKKIDTIFKKRDIALGAMGMVEAYAITRQGTMAAFGEVLKGIGEIVPL